MLAAAEHTAGDTIQTNLFYRLFYMIYLIVMDSLSKLNTKVNMAK